MPARRQDKGEEDPANEQEEKQPAPRAIAIPIVKRQRLRVNFVNRDVDVDVVRVVMNDAYPLMFSVAEFLAKALLDHAQRLSIRVFSGSERNQQMIGAI